MVTRLRATKLLTRFNKSPVNFSSPTFVARLRLALLTEYRRIHGSVQQDLRAQPGARSFWKQLIAAFRHPARGLSLRLALAVVVMLVGILLFFPNLNEITPGTAGLNGFRPWVVLGLGVVCVAIVLWLVREKKK